MAIRALICIITMFIMIASFPMQAKADVSSIATVKELIVKHSLDMGVDPALALSIAKTESNYKHSSRSRHGAIGVFQLMPNTAKRLGYNPYRLNENIKAGLTYYKMMYKMFGSVDLALAAYNAGPGNVRKYKGIPPFSETKSFVYKITKSYNDLKINPDPVIAQVKENPEKEINFEEEIGELTVESKAAEVQIAEIKELDFRYEHEEILKAYLANQGI